MRHRREDARTKPTGNPPPRRRSPRLLVIPPQTDSTPPPPLVRVVPFSPLFAVAGKGEIHCPVKHGIIAFERCLGIQAETGAAGTACTCDRYREFIAAGALPKRNDTSLIDVLHATGGP